ncbi:branched-chain-amino-acid aminotransferase-like protein 2 [Acanthaster planci]|uniref:Branched-chain-amino-acid aminotransferase-like protein 2 n=1 Tax=Acanthaster planci TaxID=133434 RepID=A0A8B7YTX0_ACAPL|nr:branched-chain-amino-acid aminotransferase-like protein 2 [Acanthaster planci]
MSTAVLKCLSYVDGIQIVNQPYATAFYYGPQAIRPEPDPNDIFLTKVLALRERIAEEGEKAELGGLAPSSMSFKGIRDEILQASYPDKKFLLCRDQAQYLDGRYDLLPRGFKYSFLIRHPYKVFRSWKKHLTVIMGDFPDMRALPSLIFPPGRGFKELFELVQHVKENIDPHPAILDADDLLQDPAGILSTYCARMGMPYSSKLLYWEPGDEITNTWIMCKVLSVSNGLLDFYKHAFESKRFDKPGPVPDPASLAEDVRACAEESMKYYESLYRERIVASPQSEG